MNIIVSNFRQYCALIILVFLDVLPILVLFSIYLIGLLNLLKLIIKLLVDIIILYLFLFYILCYFEELIFSFSDLVFVFNRCFLLYFLLPFAYLHMLFQSLLLELSFAFWTGLQILFHKLIIPFRRNWQL